MEILDKNGRKIRLDNIVKTDIPLQDKVSEYTFLGTGIVCDKFDDGTILIVSEDGTGYEYIIEGNLIEVV